MEHDAEILPADRPGSYVVRMSGMDQSHVDLDDPRRLVFEYVRRLGDVVDAVAPESVPLRVVHVGGAGLTLPRYVAATRPRSSQIVFEPATAVTELVRAELPLPRQSGIKVRPIDGRAGVTALRDASADLVVVDAFADARVPGSLVTDAFLADVARVLGPAGVVALNLTDRAPFGWTRRAVASVRSALPHLLLTAEPATLRAKRLGNLVIVASRGDVPLDALRRRATTAASPYRVLDAVAVSDSFGGGTPFTEADAEPSPPPSP
ncbi:MULTISPECIES: spermidine synthase [unclassified Nocardioides]|uniref:spermidine synthase n=1 Tax=unclassified Nocardioides TaxID=2615069 RepID=UPI0036234907